MKRFAVIFIIAVLSQLASKCSSQFLGASLAGNRGASSLASVDPVWSSSGYGLRSGSGYNAMPMDPLLSGPYPVPYNNYPQLGSLFVSSPGLGLSPPGLGLSSPGLGAPPSGSPIGYGGFNSPFTIGLPSSGVSPIGSGISYNDPSALANGNPSALSFQQPGYAMPIMTQPQATQMTENDNANTNININHDMGLHHPGMPKGLLGLARM